MRVFFFFKQETSYEMRISDWSSDVCSSDLLRATFSRFAGEGLEPAFRVTGSVRSALRPPARPPPRARGPVRPRARSANRWPGPSCPGACARAGRSEEHTSELQSLMRISYAVFCMKKQKEI